MMSRSEIKSFRRMLPLLPVLLAVLTGCLFEPRDPEPPDSEVAIDYLPRTSSRNVWGNMETSLRNLHSPGWEDAVLLSDFVYVPDTEAADLFGGVLADWDATKELSFIRALYGQTDNIEVIMRNPEFIVPEDQGGGSFWQGVIYDVIVTDLGGTVNRYRGQADITFVADGNFTYVTRWRDVRGEADPTNPGAPFQTLGVLRGTIASN